jgi:hypothetical protein
MFSLTPVISLVFAHDGSVQQNINIFSKIMNVKKLDLAISL